MGHDYIDHNISTEQGSSGAPIFDKNWKIIAIHRGNPGMGRSVNPGTSEAVPVRAIWEKIPPHLTKGMKTI